MDLFLEKFRELVENAYETIQKDENLFEAEPALVPAIKQLSTGQIFKGSSGQYHHDIAEKYGFFRPEWKHDSDYKLGFVNHKGQFLNRSQALEYAVKHDLIHDAAKRYLALDDSPSELGASFLKKPV